MGKSYTSDLRRRVVSFIESGAITAQGGAPLRREPELRGEADVALATDQRA